MQHRMLVLLLQGLVLGQDCSVGDKIDCGYMGIDQQGCQDKGCCWQPSQGRRFQDWSPISPMYCVHINLIWLETQIKKT